MRRKICGGSIYKLLSYSNCRLRHCLFGAEGALVMRSFAQKPTLSTQPKVTYKNAIPARNKHVAQAPMMSGTIAPSMIPVQRMPANEPWYSATEFRCVGRKQCFRNTSTHHNRPKTPNHLALLVSQGLCNLSID